MRRTALLLMATLAVGLAGCPGKKDPPPNPGGGPPSCLPGCAGTRDYDAVAYALSGRFDWASRELLATEEITLVVAAGATPVVSLDAAVTVTSVRAGSQRLAFAAANGTLRVDLGPLAPGAAPVTFTVEYRAPTSDALIATSSRGDDPVRSRVVFTDSEPRRGHQWLVQKDDPSDPARFSVELTVAGDEDLVANGERTADAAAPGGRKVAYALPQPIPTYLMAFAAGQLEHSDHVSAGGTPLSLWYRRGLALDPSETLGQLASAMASFEPLVGPYPFSRYAVVLLPGFGGGMENATITFEGEVFSQGPYGFGLHAHELAHQWFGDRVTMHGYDDVWVKEGMATLLAAEATRPWSDPGGMGRLMASDFVFDPADAIVDTRLTGLDKYTSGPYERAAALITQIRARLGEAVFWARLRRFLDDHALGSATGEQFLRAFAPALGEAEIQQVLGILPQFALPVFTVELLPGATPQVRLSLSDPTRLLLAPYGLTVVDAAGGVATHSLAAGSSLLVDLPAGGYLAPDEEEVHPDVPAASPVFVSLGPYLQPAPGTPAGALFASRSAAHQERALLYGGLPALAAADFQAYYGALDSELGTLRALWEACGVVNGLPAPDQAAWIAALTPIFDAPRFTRPSALTGRCGPGLGAAFLAQLTGLVVGASAAQLGRFEYLLWFDYGADGFAPLSQVATGAPSLKLRDRALVRLAYQANAIYYSLVPADQVAAWAAFFRARLAAADSFTRFYWTWYGVVGLGDGSALAEAGAALQRVATPAWFQEMVVCQAHGLSAAEPGSWASFQATASPWSALAPSAAALLSNPAGCAGLGYFVDAAGGAAQPSEPGGRGRTDLLEAKGAGPGGRARMR